jgi:tetratricopeptide (TPR) repeat protein
MDEDFLRSLSIEKDPKEVLWDVTRDNLATLPPAVEDAAYRGAIVHWFDPPILEALVGDGRLSNLGRPFAEDERTGARLLYEQLQRLPFVEEFPGRGHSFHELTRRAVLAQLWSDEREFYKEVSAKAANFYGKELESEEGASWDEVIEWAYHLLIADETAAVESLGGFLNELIEKGNFNYCHALVQVAEEHANDGRLSSETLPVVKYWRLKITYSSGSFDKTIQLASEMRSADDATVPPSYKAVATQFIADSLSKQEKYAAAYDVYLEALAEYEHLESPEDMAVILRGMGGVSFALDDFKNAETCFMNALSVYVPTLLYPLTSDPDSSEDEQVAIPKLQILNPYAWHRILSDDPGTDQETVNDSPSNGESKEQTQQIMYGIEVETEAPINSEAQGQDIPLTQVRITEILADIWIRLGELWKYQDYSDHAGVCGRLGGQMFDDLGNNYGVLRALTLLRALGEDTGNLELKESVVDLEEDVLNTARQEGDRSTQLAALLNLAANHASSLRSELARRYYGEALELARSMKDVGQQATAIEGLAGLDFDSENYGVASTRYEEALNLYRQADYREGQARALLGLGDVDRMRNRTPQAVEHYSASLNLFGELKIPSQQCHALRGLGLTLQTQGHYTQATQHFESARVLARDMKILSLEATILSDLADAYRLLKEKKKARESYQQSLELTKELGRPALLAETLLAFGDLAVEQGDFNEGTDYYQQARQIYVDLKRPNNELNALIGLLNIHQKNSKLQDFLKTADEAQTLARSLDDHDHRIRALLRLVESLRAHDHYDRVWSILDEMLALQPENPSYSPNQG